MRGLAWEFVTLAKAIKLARDISAVCLQEVQRFHEMRHLIDMRDSALLWTRAILMFLMAVTAIRLYLSLESNQVVTQDEWKDPKVVRAVEAVEHFRSAINEERYQDVCKISAPHAFDSVTGATCGEYLEYFHHKLGKPVGAWPTRVPGIGTTRNDGVGGVDLNYETQYAQGTAYEHFEWQMNRDKLTLKFYTVRADALWR